MTAAEEMLKAEKEGKAVYGTDKTIRALKNGEVAKVFITANFS